MYGIWFDYSMNSVSLCCWFSEVKAIKIYLSKLISSGLFKETHSLLIMSWNTKKTLRADNQKVENHLQAGCQSNLVDFKINWTLLLRLSNFPDFLNNSTLQGCSTVSASLILIIYTMSINRIILWYSLKGLKAAVSGKCNQMRVTVNNRLCFVFLVWVL